MGDEAEFGDIVAVIDEPFYEFFVAGLRKGFGTSHDPDITTVRDTDDSRLIGIVEISDEVGSLKRPNKLHTPLGISLVIIDEATWVVSLEGPGEIALVKHVGGRNCAIGVELVTFDTIKGVVFDEGGDVCDDVPVAHETIQINPSVDSA